MAGLCGRRDGGCFCGLCGLDDSGLGRVGWRVGAIGAHGVDLILSDTGISPQVFCVLGMGALFTAIVRAPLTGIILMLELTRTYDFMLPLLVSCLCAYGVAEALGKSLTPAQHARGEGGGEKG